MLLRRELSSSVTTVSGSGTSTRSSRASRTASRAAAACSRRLPRPSRSRTSAVSSSAVSNSEASWANSSSKSGSSCSWTWVDLDGHLDVLADQVAADQLGGEGLLVAGGHAGQRLVEAVEHAAAADLVGHAGQLGALDGLAVLAGRARSMTTKSPSAAARSTSTRVAKRSRSAATCSSTSSSLTATSSTCAVRSSYAGRVISGLTSTSAVNSRDSLSSRRVTSISGWASGWRSLSWSAWM